MKKQQIDRINAMSRRYRELREAAPQFLDNLETLQEYMDSGAWLEDFEADERGELPKRTDRAVLSEDGLYNLLQDLQTIAGNSET